MSRRHKLVLAHLSHDFRLSQVTSSSACSTQNTSSWTTNLCTTKRCSTVCVWHRASMHWSQATTARLVHRTSHVCLSSVVSKRSNLVLSSWRHTSDVLPTRTASYTDHFHFVTWPTYCRSIATVYSEIIYLLATLWLSTRNVAIR